MYHTWFYYIHVKYYNPDTKASRNEIKSMKLLEMDSKTYPSYSFIDLSLLNDIFIFPGCQNCRFISVPLKRSHIRTLPHLFKNNFKAKHLNWILSYIMASWPRHIHSFPANVQPYTKSQGAYLTRKFTPYDSKVCLNTTTCTSKSRKNSLIRWIKLTKHFAALHHYNQMRWPPSPLAVPPSHVLTWNLCCGHAPALSSLYLSFHIGQSNKRFTLRGASRYWDLWLIFTSICTQWCCFTYPADTWIRWLPFHFNSFMSQKISPNVTKLHKQHNVT